MRKQANKGEPYSAVESRALVTSSVKYDRFTYHIWTGWNCSCNERRLVACRGLGRVASDANCSAGFRRAGRTRRSSLTLCAVPSQIRLPTLFKVRKEGWLLPAVHPSYSNRSAMWRLAAFHPMHLVDLRLGRARRPGHSWCNLVCYVGHSDELTLLHAFLSLQAHSQ